MSTDYDSSENTDIHVDLGETYMSMLNKLAESYYGSNRTQTLRRAIHFLNERHDDESEQRHLEDRLVQKLDEVNHLVRTLEENLETVEEEIEKLHREPVVEGHSNRRASAEATDEVYSELKTSEDPLSKNGLIEQTNLDLVELGLALDTLLDEGIVYEDSQGGTVVDRYGIHGVTYDD